jgi:hypothetical protein
MSSATLLGLDERWLYEQIRGGVYIGNDRQGQVDPGKTQGRIEPTKELG